VDRSSAQGALVEAPRGMGCGVGVPIHLREGSGRPFPRNFFYYLTSKWTILVLHSSWISQKKQGCTSEMAGCSTDAVPDFNPYTVIRLCQQQSANHNLTTLLGSVRGRNVVNSPKAPNATKGAFWWSSWQLPSGQ